jgi:hypothetical protein
VSSPLQMVLDRLERVKRSGKGWIACCPAHNDRHPSLSIGVGSDDRVLLYCYAGCEFGAICAALGPELAALLGGGEGGSPPEEGCQVRQVVQVGPRLVASGGVRVDTAAGLTVEQLAAAKELPVDLLVSLGCETVGYFGSPAVQVPYYDEEGELVGSRYRLGSKQFKWKKGEKASTLLYGVNRMEEIREAGFVLLVEGESDAWTLMHHGFPVLAVPGAGMWNEDQAARLDGIETVYLVVEPDKGGETLVAKLHDSTLQPRVKLVRLPTKDVSELHLLDPTAFPQRLREAMERATTLLAEEEEHRRAEGAAHWEKCCDLAIRSDILDLFENELRSRGFVGPTGTPKLIFLVLVSRLLPRPVSLVLRGLSSAGKSYNVESVLPFFPQSAYFGRSGMSERALVYSEEDFRHRILYIVEAEPVAGEGLGAYFLRTLISENKLVYETTEKDGDRLITRVIEKPGPTGVILTTTRLRLHPENETRMLSLTVSDDPQLTRQIMRAIAVRDDEPTDNDTLEPWWALQWWLELGGERRVTDENRFLLALAEMIRVVAVRLRRDFALVRSLIFAHALLHQASRPRDSADRVVATLQDYAAVRELVAEIVAEGIGATVSDDVRETVAAVEAALERAEETVVRRVQVQAELGLDGRATNRRLSQAVDAGFVENTNPGRGKPGLYKIGNPIPDNIDVLPSVDYLRRKLDNQDSLASDQGADDPSPFHDGEIERLAALAVQAQEQHAPGGAGDRREAAPLPADTTFVDYINIAHENGHITEQERLERIELHDLISRSRLPACKQRVPNEVDTFNVQGALFEPAIFEPPGNRKGPP